MGGQSNIPQLEAGKTVEILHAAGRENLDGLIDLFGIGFFECGCE